MKTMRRLLFALGLLLHGTAFGATQAFFGTVPETNTMNANTQYLVGVMGSVSNSPIRRINPSNALEMFKVQQNWPLYQGADNGLSNIVQRQFTTISNAAILYVSPDGDNATAKKGRLDKKWKDPRAAVDAATLNDLVVVMPGAYQTNDLFRVNVSIWFEPGAILSWTQTVASGKAVFDDTGIATGYTNLIGGHGKFRIYNAVGQQLTNGLFKLNNGSGHTVFTYDELLFGGFTNTYAFTPFNVTNVGTFVARGAHTQVHYSGLSSGSWCTIARVGYGKSFFDFGIFDLDEDVILVAEHGGAEATVRWTRNSVVLAIPGAIQTGTNFTGLIDVRADDISLPLDTGIRARGGTVTMEANSIYAGLPALAEGGTVRLKAQRLSADTSFAKVVTGAVHLAVNEYVEAGGGPIGAGFSNAMGTLVIDGGRFRPTGGGRGLAHAGGLTLVRNMQIDTSATPGTNNFPLYVSAPGLTLEDVTLIAPTNNAAWNLYAPSAQTVTNYGVLGGGRVHANVTLATVTNAVSALDAKGNVALRGGVALPALTASRALIINASGDATNVTSATPSSHFVRADGVASAPFGGTSTNLDSENFRIEELSSMLRIFNESLSIRQVDFDSTSGDMTFAGGNTMYSNGPSVFRRAVTFNGTVATDTNSTVGGTNVPNWQRMPNLTASKAVILDANKTMASPSGTADATTFLRGDGTYAVPSGGSGGTNFEAVINLGAGTNVNVGSGTRQAVLTTTNASFKFTFTGSALNGEEVRWFVKNTSTTADVYPTNTSGIRDLSSPTNLLATTFLVTSNTTRLFHFKYNTPEAEWQLIGGSRAGMDVEWTIVNTTNNNKVTLAYTGSGHGVASNAPVILNPTIKDAGGVGVTFDFGSPSAGQAMKFHSSGIVTNDTDATGGSGGAATNEIDFTIAIIPDTQTYNQGDSNIFFNAMQHLLTNATVLNLRAVVGEGDIVQSGNSLVEWTNGVIGWGKIYSNNIPVLVPQGNHDFDDNGTTFIGTRALTNFNTYFGTNYYRAKPWFNGDFYGDSNHSENAYIFITNGSTVYGLMQLEFGPRTNIMSWATNVIGSNSMVQWLITTHSYMYRDNSRVDSADLYNPSTWQCCTNSADGEEMWNYGLKKFGNLMAIVSGHDLGDGQGRLAEKNSWNRLVNQFLFNYQAGTDDGGTSGRIQLFTFRPQHNLVEVRTYSPVTDTYTTTSEYEFGFPIRLVDNRITSAGESFYVDEFLDDSAGSYWLQTLANAGTVTWAADPPVAGLFGWNFVAAAGSSNGAATIYIPVGAAGHAFFGTTALEVRGRIQTPALSTDANLYEMAFGFGDSTSAVEPVDGAYFFYTHGFFGGNWGAKTANNSTRTSATNNTPVVVTGTSIWDWRVVATSAQADFYVSSNLGSTWTQIGSSVANIPSAAGREFSLFMYIVKKGGSDGTGYRGFYNERVQLMR